LRLVLDSNEYIIGIGSRSSPHPIRLLNVLAAWPQRFEVFVSRMILDEVRRNLPADRFQDLWAILVTLDAAVVEEWEIPSEYAGKYASLGLKPGDAAIAACAEVVRAEIVVTENRDFHGRSGLPFRSLRAEDFLKEQGAADQSV